MTRRSLLTALLLAVFALVTTGDAGAQAGKPIRIGFGMALTGGLAGNGQGALLAMQIWRDDVNKAGRAPRAARRAGLLRRPDESGDGARHLLQAARHRQGRPRRLRLRDQPHRARHAHHDRAQAPVHGPVRARQQPEAQVLALLPDRPQRAGSRRLLLRGLLRARGQADPQAEDGRARRRRRASSRRTRWSAPASTPSATASRPSTTRRIRRTRWTTRRSCAPSSR